MAGSGAKAAITELMSPYRESPVDRAVAEPAVRVRREAGIRLPDALIPATARAHRLSLLPGMSATLGWSLSCDGAACAGNYSGGPVSWWRRPSVRRSSFNRAS